MKMMEIMVAPNGETTVPTKGFGGGTCRDAGKLIEEALGQRTEETLTAEFHAVQGTHQANQTRS